MVRSVLSKIDSPYFSTKKRMASIEDAHRLIIVKYPNALRHGSCGSWHWVQDSIIVAEAWACQYEGWWLRVRKSA